METDTPGTWPARKGSGEQGDMIYIQEQYKQVEQDCLELESQRLERCKISHSHFLLSLSTFCIVPPLLSYLHLSSEEQLQVHWSFALLLKMKWNMINYYLFNTPSSHKRYLYFFLRTDNRTQRYLLFILCGEFLPKNLNYNTTSLIILYYFSLKKYL